VASHQRLEPGAYAPVVRVSSEIAVPQGLGRIVAILGIIVAPTKVERTGVVGRSPPQHLLHWSFQPVLRQQLPSDRCLTCDRRCRWSWNCPSRSTNTSEYQSFRRSWNRARCSGLSQREPIFIVIWTCATHCHQVAAGVPVTPFRAPSASRRSSPPDCPAGLRIFQAEANFRGTRKSSLAGCGRRLTALLYYASAGVGVSVPRFSRARTA
jgi:hypothetical protein